MLHRCIVPQCTNNSETKTLGLQFYRLPLHDENFLKIWLVNIRRANVHINEYSRVCSAHFEGGRKKDNDVSTIFAWAKPVTQRAPPKVHYDPPPKKSRSVGITVKIQPESHVGTSLITVHTVNKKVLVKPDLVSTADMATQAETPKIRYSETSTMTDGDDGFRIEKIKDDQNVVQFYTGFTSMELLMVCFTFLGKAASKLSYRDRYKLSKRKPHKLSPLNEFF